MFASSTLHSMFGSKKVPYLLSSKFTRTSIDVVLLIVIGLYSADIRFVPCKIQKVHTAVNFARSKDRGFFKDFLLILDIASYF